MKRPEKEALKKHAFFKGIDWEKLERKEIIPPQLEPLEEDEISVAIVRIICIYLKRLNVFRELLLFSMILIILKKISLQTE